MDKHRAYISIRGHGRHAVVLIDGKDISNVVQAAHIRWDVTDLPAEVTLRLVPEAVTIDVADALVKATIIE